MQEINDPIVEHENTYNMGDNLPESLLQDNKFVSMSTTNLDSMTNLVCTTDTTPLQVQWLVRTPMTNLKYFELAKRKWWSSHWQQQFLHKCWPKQV